MRWQISLILLITYFCQCHIFRVFKYEVFALMKLMLKKCGLDEMEAVLQKTKNQSINQSTNCYVKTVKSLYDTYFFITNTTLFFFKILV